MGCKMCTLNGKTKTIGHFDSANDAAIAHSSYTRSKYGEFFPNQIEEMAGCMVDE